MPQFKTFIWRKKKKTNNYKGSSEPMNILMQLLDEWDRLSCGPGWMSKELVRLIFIISRFWWCALVLDLIFTIIFKNIYIFFCLWSPTGLSESLML